MITEELQRRNVDYGGEMLIAEDYRRLQRKHVDCRRLQNIIEEICWLQKITEDYRGDMLIAEDYRRL